jgi:hypothetical protein
MSFEKLQDALEVGDPFLHHSLLRLPPLGISREVLGGKAPGSLALRHLRKATVRPEALTLDRRRERHAGGREYQTCRRYGKTFSGGWRDHAKSNCTRRTETVKPKE